MKSFRCHKLDTRQKVWLYANRRSWDVGQVKRPTKKLVKVGWTCKRCGRKEIWDSPALNQGPKS